MKGDRSNLEYKRTIREDRYDLKPKDEPRDYSSLSLKYGKYLDQEKIKKQDEVPKFDPKNPYGPVTDKNEEAANSTDYEDEEEQMLGRTNDGLDISNGTKKRKKKRVKGKKKKVEEYMNIL